MGFFSNNKKPVLATQDFLQFAEIHDGIVITKQGELRSILLVSSINFALKSEQEQNAIIFAFQSFLNSLNFPIQITMQSRKLDLSKYLAKLNETANLQSNELLRAQTMDYMDFVVRLINIANIMDKKFYVVIPYMPPATSQPLVSNNKNKQSFQMTPKQFEDYRQELEQRIKVVQSGLGSVGLRSAELNTQQIIEVFYEIYNPEEAAKEKLIDFNQLSGGIVESAANKQG